MKDRVCTSCGHVGKPINQCLASFLVDVLIWGVVGGAALATGVLPLLVVPIAWTIYHLTKFGTTKCPECGDLEMVSMNSRKGQEALNREDKIQVWTPSEEEFKKAA